MLKAPILASIPHGFSTLDGSAPEDILPGAPLVLPRQVHSADVVTITAPLSGAPPAADGLVTDRPGLLLGIITADCAPVLLADLEAGVIGAAHAGWRGALAGVLENTVTAMKALGARSTNIIAAIGPTIGQDSYEVDTEFHDRLVAHDAANIDLMEPGRPGHFQFDLPAYVTRRLRYSAGVKIVQNLDEDTYAQPTRFFSYRRATHRGEPTGGRQTSVIGLQHSL